MGFRQDSDGRGRKKAAARWRCAAASEQTVRLPPTGPVAGPMRRTLLTTSWDRSSLGSSEPPERPDFARDALPRARIAREAETHFVGVVGRSVVPARGDDAGRAVHVGGLEVHLAARAGRVFRRPGGFDAPGLFDATASVSMSGRSRTSADAEERGARVLVAGRRAGDVCITGTSSKWGCVVAQECRPVLNSGFSYAFRTRLPGIRRGRSFFTCPESTGKDDGGECKRCTAKAIYPTFGEFSLGVYRNPVW